MLNSLFQLKKKKDTKSHFGEEIRMVLVEKFHLDIEVSLGHRRMDRFQWGLQRVGVKGEPLISDRWCDLDIFKF